MKEEEYRGYYYWRDQLRTGDMNDRRIAAVVDEMSNWRGFRHMTDDMDEEDAEDFFKRLRTAINDVYEATE